LLDGHELVREVALANQLTPGVDRDLLGERGDLRELLVRHVLKQGDRPEPACVQRVLLVASTSSRRLYRGAAGDGVTARAGRTWSLPRGRAAWADVPPTPRDRSAPMTPGRARRRRGAARRRARSERRGRPRRAAGTSGYRSSPSRRTTSCGRR